VQVLRELMSWLADLRLGRARLGRFRQWRFSLPGILNLPGLLHVVIVGLLALTLLSAWVPTADGRTSLLEIWQQELHQPKHGIERLGNVEVMPVQFEGTDLFTLASPTVWDRHKPTQQFPIEMRVKQVEANLNHVIEGGFLQGAKDGLLTNFDPKTLQVSVVSLNDVPVIVATDSYHSQPLKLVTVTYIDADYNGQPTAELAEQWRSLIYQNLYTALLDRSPDAVSLRGKLGESLLALAVMLAASLLIWLLQVPLRRRNRHLRMQQTALTAEWLSPMDEANLNTSPPSTSPAAESIPEPRETSAATRLISLRNRFVVRFGELQSLQQQRQVVSFFRWLLAWSQVAVWLAGLSLALALFPWTRPALSVLRTPAILLTLWFSVGLVNRMTSTVLQGMALAWVNFGASAADEPQRDQFRVFTILAAIQPLKSIVIYTTGLVAAFVHLGLPLSLVLCLGGVVGLATLLICQGFVRDSVMGLLILWDDQYAIGDVIVVAEQIGLVERMNLRLTQMQTAEGGLLSIAHGSLTKIENLTRSWLHREAGHSASPKPPLGSRLTMASPNPFSSIDSLNDIDPFSVESPSSTVTKG